MKNLPKYIKLTNKQISAIIFVLLLIMLGKIAFDSYQSNKISKIVDCLNEKKVVMYGADWCKHCQEEKKLFGKSFEKINFVRCNDVEGGELTQECKDNNISRFPTWILDKNTRIEGVYLPESISNFASCNL